MNVIYTVVILVCYNSYNASLWLWSILSWSEFGKYDISVSILSRLWMLALKLPPVWHGHWYELQIIYLHLTHYCWIYIFIFHNVTVVLIQVMGLLRWEQLGNVWSQFLLQIVLCTALPRLINRRDFLMTVALDTIGLVELSLASCPKQVGLSFCLHMFVPTLVLYAQFQRIVIARYVLLLWYTVLLFQYSTYQIVVLVVVVVFLIQ